jgi:hypothetical protein
VQACPAGPFARRFCLLRTRPSGRWLAALATGLATAAFASPFDSVSVTSSLGFGTVAVLGSGSVTLHPLGGRTAQGSVYLVNPDHGAPAQVLVRSTQPNLVFSMSIPDQIVLTAANGETLRVTSLTSTPAVKSTGPGSALVVSIGGTLQFTRSPEPGTYQGSFPVTVFYP